MAAEDLDTELLLRLARRYVRPLLGWMLVVGGLVLLTLGWIGVSGEALVAKQLPYLVSGGLGGLVLSVVGGLLIGGHDLRGMGQRLERLEQQVGDLHAVLLAERTVADAAERQEAVATTAPGEVVALPEGARFHASDCPIVSGKDGLERLTVDDAGERGLEPCRVCDPVASASAG